MQGTKLNYQHKIISVNNINRNKSPFISVLSCLQNDETMKRIKNKQFRTKMG